MADTNKDATSSISYKGLSFGIIRVPDRKKLRLYFKDDSSEDNSYMCYGQFNDDEGAVEYMAFMERLVNEIYKDGFERGMNEALNMISANVKGE